MSQYDEDLTENSFFKAVLTHIESLENVFVVLIPQRKSIPSKFEDLDIKAHILNQTETEKYQNQLNEIVFIEDSKIQYGDLSVNILFSETHYGTNLKKVKVYCIQRPLTEVTFEFDTSQDESDAVLESILDFQQAQKYISTQVTSSDFNFILKKLDNLARNVIKLAQNSKSEDSLGPILKRNFEKTLQRFRNHLKLPENVNFDKACEVYFYHVIYPDLFPYVCAKNRQNDAQLNQKILTVSRLKPSNLRPDLEVTIPASKANITILVQSTCPMSKIEALNGLLELPALESKSVMNSDDLLPWLIQALSQNSVKNFYSQLDFISNYNFTSLSQKELFNLSTFEAALEFMKNTKYNPSPEDLWFHSNEELNPLYHAIYLGDLNWVQEIISENTKTKCHPLCDCDHCSKLDIILSKDDLNLTNPISLSCWLGQPLIVEYFLSFDMILNSLKDTDKNGRTPLHLAAFHGHQNALLLLLNAKVNANTKDNVGMTALHYAAGHGFESCTKALLYNAEHQSYPLEVSVQNHSGNTPLHFASKNGFINIVKLLIEYGALKTVKNQNGEIPRDISHDIEIKSILT